MKMLKPFLSVLLAIVMFFSIFSCAYPVLAAQLSETPEVEESEPEPQKKTRTVGELNALRTENTKTFQLSDGSKKAAVYPQNIHFIDHSGIFTEYDNTLRETEDAFGAAYAPAASDLDIRIAADSGGERLVTVQKDDYFLSWTYEDIKTETGVPGYAETDEDPETLDTFAASLSFYNIFKETDLQYILYGGELKENIVLNDKTAPCAFNVRFLCPGLTAVCGENGKSLLFKNAAGEIVFEINAPYAADADGEAFYDITYTVTETSDAGITAKLCIDEAWLTAKERAFPVVIDPVLLTKQEYTAAGNASAYVASATPTACYGYGGNSYEGSLYAGYASGRGRMRSFIKFSLPALKTADRVVAANMYTYLWDASPDVTVKLMKVTQSWNVSTVNWNNQPDCDYNTVYEYNFLKDTSFNTYESRFIDWDITKLVDGWYQGDPNYGVMLASDAEYGAAYKRAWFFSTHYPSEIQIRPLLAVEYRNTSGYEDSYSYLNVSAGRGGEAGVNLYNGNLVVSQPVTAIYGGARMPVSIKAIYNANKGAAETGEIGVGWQLNYQLYIRANPYITNDSTDEEKKFRYYLNDADGTEHYFYFENDNSSTGTDEDGLGYTLDVGAEPSQPDSERVRYTITKKNGGKMKFNDFGNLIEICDTNGNSITLKYDNPGNNTQYERLIKIKDGAGKDYNLYYYANHPTQIDYISDPTNRTTYFFAQSGYLQTITFPDSEHITFTYDNDTQKSLLSITNIDGVTATATYAVGTIKRAASLTVATSSSIAKQYTFNYRQNTTDVTDLQGHSYSYQFDQFGHNTGVVYNDALEAQAYVYEPGNEPGDKNANKLKTASRTQTPVNNYVKNPSFHTGVANYSVYKSVSSDTSTGLYDSAYGHYANGSLRVTQPTGSSGYILALQAVYVPAGTYTVSCYVSTNGAALSAAAPMLSVEVRNSSAHLYSRTAEQITGTGTGKWERQSVTVTITSGQFLRVQLGLLQGRCGTVWFDDVQVEAEAGVSSFNILENPQFFNNASAWTFSDSSIAVNTASPLTSGGKYATLPGDEDTEYTVSQTVDFSGTKGQVFSFGAWARAQSVPVGDDKGGGISLTADFKLRITLINGNETQDAEAVYNPYVSDWQFTSGSIVANSAFTSVRITFIYSHNMNTADVTGLYCLAEEYGETYTYDGNGNLVSSADVAKVENAYGYAENNLTSAQSDSRDRSFAGYEEDTKNLSYTVNTEGQFAEYCYDNRGNLNYAEMTPAHFTTTLQTNKTYRIINAETGMALGASSTQATADAVNARISNEQTTKWMLITGSGDDVYKLKRSGVTAYLAVDGSGESSLPLKSKTGVASTDQAQFRFVLQSDGSFKILTKTSSFHYVVDAHWNENDTADVDYPVYQHQSIDDDASQKWYLFEVSSNTSKMIAEASYNNNGLPTQVTDVNGATTEYSYDSHWQVRNVKDPNCNNVSYSYNSMGQITDVIGGLLFVEYDYSNDLLASLSTTGSVTYSFTRDDFGRLTKTKANNITLAQTQYDAYGRVTSQKDAGNRTTAYSYDSLDRVSAVTYNGDTIGYYYGSNGKLAQATDSAADTRTKYVYDLAGRVVSERTYTGTALDVSNLQSALDYTYTDGTNQLSAIKTKSTLGTNTLGVTYGDLMQAQSAQLVYGEQWNGVNARAYGYDPFGRLQQTVTYTGGTNLTGTYTYASDPGDSTVTTMRVSQLQTSAATYTYTYDNNGNILSESDGTYTTTYAYDANNRLARENNQRAGYTYSYTYVGGNIDSRKTYAYTTVPLDTLVPLSTDTYTYYTGVWKDLLIQYNNKNIVYSGAEPVIYGSYTLDWYKTGLISEYTNGLDTHSYTYDVSGRRLEKEDNGVTTEFIYAGDLLLGQKTGSNSLVFKFDSNGDYFGFTYNGTPYYYVKNLQGDVVAIANNAGTIVARYYYDAWGKLLSYTDTSGVNIATINPIRYRSYYYDTETGFYFLQSRYYDPEIGRFISPDDPDFLGADGTLNGYHLFAYCDNNPVIFCDPLGCIAIETLIFIGSAIIGLGVGVYTGYKLRKAGADWYDTILYSFTAGLSIFDLVFTGGMCAYDTYCNICYSYGFTPVTDINVFNKASNSYYQTNSIQYNIDTYNNIRKTTRGTDLEAHHILEKRFARVFDITNTNEMLSVGLTKAEHRVITNSWRTLLPYGSVYTDEQIIDAAYQVYKSYPAFYQAVLATIY